MLSKARLSNTRRATWRAASALLALLIACAVTAQDEGEIIDEIIKPPASELPLPEKVQERDQITPTVTIRQEGGLVIEEYRVAGQLRSVRVTNENGFSYDYVDIDGDGRLERNDRSDGTVAPIFYTLYEWE